MKKKQTAKDVKISVPVEIIQNKIYLIRGHKVMLDKELAELYEVSTRRLKEQVRRNSKRFPTDFMFELTWKETLKFSSRSQFATLKKGRNIKYLPFAFTEQGVAMLSSVLNTDRAIEVNIQIMRIFTKLREMMISHKNLARKIEDLERKFQDKFKEHDQKFILIFNAIKDLLSDKEEAAKKRGPMGFVVPKD
jgi:ORF6N domain